MTSFKGRYIQSLVNAFIVKLHVPHSSVFQPCPDNCPLENYQPQNAPIQPSPGNLPNQDNYLQDNEAFRNIAFITSSSLNQGNHIKKLNLFDGYKCEQAPQAFSRNSIRTFHKILGKIAVFSTFLESQINFGIYTEWIFGEMLQKNPIISNHLISLTYVDHYKS